MKKNSFLSLIVCFAFAMGLGSCKKQELPPESISNALFFAKGALNGGTFSLAAGENNTILDATYKRNKYGVIEYQARFQNTQNSEELRFYIQNNERSVFPNSPVDINQAIQPGTYDFQSEDYNLDSLTLQLFTPEKEGFVYNWVINGEPYLNDNAPIVNFTSLGELDAKLVVSNPDTGCSDSLTQTHEAFDGDYVYYPFYSEPFEHMITNNNGAVKFMYEGETLLEEINSIRFQIVENGQTFLYEETTEFTHVFSTPGPHKVVMNIELNTGNGDSYAFRYAENIIAQDIESCAAIIQYEPSPIDYDVSKVKIEYVDSDGETWSTFNTAIEGSDSDFSVLSVSNNIPTSEGRDALGVSATVNCILYKLSNPEEQMELSNLQTNFAVGFPQ